MVVTTGNMLDAASMTLDDVIKRVAEVIFENEIGPSDNLARREIVIVDGGLVLTLGNEVRDSNAASAFGRSAKSPDWWPYVLDEVDLLREERKKKLRADMVARREEFERSEHAELFRLAEKFGARLTWTVGGE